MAVKAMVTLSRTIAAIPSMLVFATFMAIGSLEDAPTAYGRGYYATALLIRPLAEQGNAIAQYNLAVMYDEGQGVPQNQAEAMKWYRLAADQGHARAQYTLGNIYHEGRGVKQNDAEAFNWYRLAADQGDAEAQFNVGAMYAHGQGLAHYLVNALMWFNLAAAQGTERAVRAGELIAKDLTPIQIAEARELARNWKPTKQPITLAEKSAAFYRATFLDGTRHRQGRQIDQNNHALPVAPTVAYSPRGETVNHASPSFLPSAKMAARPWSR